MQEVKLARLSPHHRGLGGSIRAGVGVSGRVRWVLFATILLFLGFMTLIFMPVSGPRLLKSLNVTRVEGEGTLSQPEDEPTDYPIRFEEEQPQLKIITPSDPHPIPQINGDLSKPADSLDDIQIETPHGSLDVPSTPPPSPFGELPCTNSEFDSSLDSFVIALKTGKEVALERVPVQLLTFLRGVRNLVVIGEAPKVQIGNIRMIDVYTDLYKNLEKNSPTQRLLRRETSPESPIPPPPLPKPDSNQTLLKREIAAGEVVPNQGSEGWRLDAHKNLPGFRHMYEKYPDAKWFVMIDDDTYLFVKNLKRMVDDFDPEEEHYFGVPNMFMGCDGVKKFGDGPAFAHGGSGIVISRGAIKKMMSGIDKCILKYKDCWAGDVRTALCLRDHRILLEGKPGFHGTPPNQKFGWPKDPCQRPITFHHLYVRQIQQIYEAVEQAREAHVEKPPPPPSSVGTVTKRLSTAPEYLISYGDLFQAFYKDFDMASLEHDTNRPGYDYKNQPSENAAQCQDMCKSEQQCMAWALDGGRCWLKNGIPSKSSQSGVISGTFPEKYRCY
ncbi:hypothetical protein HK102_001999 [Quaeritorhiza haematococci]|nr:hypothetical protein HK102_001999 [Quaeritorhiza haematococci]